jgi:hypothetical protein
MRAWGKGMTMTVRGKFTVISWTDFGTSSRSVKLMPIYDTDTPEDQRFAKATPSGSIEMTIDNPVALAELQIGKRFYVDFIPVEAPQPA